MNIEREQNQSSEIKESPLRDLEGIYRGFTPSDSSDTGYGEIEINITKEKFIIRVATGIEIKEKEMQISEENFHELSAKEIQREFPRLSDTEGVRVFADENKDPIIAFTKDDGDAVSIRLFNSTADEYMGPTMLFTPSQIEKGSFDKAIQEIESFSRAKFPRINTSEDQDIHQS